MMAIEADHYGETRERLVNDPIVQRMAEGVRGVPRDELAHPEGNPRYGFMMSALREYRARTGREPDCHIGGVAEAILMILDKP